MNMQIRAGLAPAGNALRFESNRSPAHSSSLFVPEGGQDAVDTIVNGESSDSRRNVVTRLFNTEAPAKSIWGRGVAANRVGEDPADRFERRTKGSPAALAASAGAQAKTRQLAFGSWLPTLGKKHPTDDDDIWV